MPHNAFNFIADQEEESIISAEAFERLSDTAKAKFLASRGERTPRGRVSDEVHTHKNKNKQRKPTHTHNSAWQNGEWGMRQHTLDPAKYTSIPCSPFSRGGAIGIPLQPAVGVAPQGIGSTVGTSKPSSTVGTSKPSHQTAHARGIYA